MASLACMRTATIQRFHLRGIIEIEESIGQFGAARARGYVRHGLHSVLIGVRLRGPPAPLTRADPVRSGRPYYNTVVGPLSCP